MEEIQELYQNINQLNKIISDVNLIELYGEMEENNKKLKSENIRMKKEIQDRDSIINMMSDKYASELKQKNDEIVNLTKVSMLQSVNKQLNEKTNYIQILEGQLEKLRIKQDIKIHEEPELETSVSQEKEEVEIEETKLEFDPDNFEEVNGFELLVYKKNYYFRDLETNELYDIDDNKPSKIVGLINSKGKPKFN